MLLIAQLMSLCVNGQNPTLDWAFNVENQNAPTGYTGNGHDIALFGEYVYVAGTFAGTADFDPGPETSELTSFGGFDIFIQKLDTNGNFIWAKQFGGPQDDGGTIVTSPFNGYPHTLGLSINTTEQGDLILAATFTDSIDCDPDPNSSFWLYGGQPEMTACFVAKISEDGDLMWAKRTASAESNVYSSAVDNGGNIYLAGNFSFWVPVDFNPSPMEEHYLTSNIYDVFLQKLSPDGVLEWVIQYPSVNSNGVWVETDQTGSVVLISTFNDSIDLDPGSNEYMVVDENPNGPATFISKLSTNGALVWGGVIQSGGGGVRDPLAIDGTGKIYFTDVISQTTDVDFTADTTYVQAAFSSPTSFIAKYDPSGTLVWVRVMPDTWPLSLTVKENLWISGVNSDQVDFDPGPSVQPGSGMNDSYVVSLDANGQFRWVHNFSTSSIMEVRSLEIVGNSIFGTGFSSLGVGDCSPDASVVPLGEDMFLFKWTETFLVGAENADMGRSNTVRLYPNPTTDQVYVYFETPEEFEVQVYSAIGQLCHSQVFEPNERVALKLGDNRGMYHVVLYFSDRTESFKVIKE